MGKRIWRCGHFPLSGPIPPPHPLSFSLHLFPLYWPRKTSSIEHRMSPGSPQALDQQEAQAISCLPSGEPPWTHHAWHHAPGRDRRPPPLNNHIFAVDLHSTQVRYCLSFLVELFSKARHLLHLEAIYEISFYTP